MNECMKKVIDYYKQEFKDKLLVALKPFEDELDLPTNIRILIEFTIGQENPNREKWKRKEINKRCGGKCH